MFFKIFERERERERQSMSEGGAEREGDRIQSRLQIQAVSKEPYKGLKPRNQEIMT